MRIVVTRPEPEGQRTAMRLTALGHDPVQMPLFKMSVTASPDDLPPAETVGGLIATSARAFAMFEGRNGLPPGLREVTVHVVGSATGHAAREAGFTTIHESGGTAQALARTLVADTTPVGRDVGAIHNAADEVRLVYLAGVPRTTVIETALAATGRPFSVVECYKMNEISYSTDILKSDILSPFPDAVLFYSANAARRFCALVGPKVGGNVLKSTRFACLSPTIAAELPQDWRDRSIAAEHPDEDSLLACLTALS